MLKQVITSVFEVLIFQTNSFNLIVQNGIIIFIARDVIYAIQYEKVE